MSFILNPFHFFLIEALKPITFPLTTALAAFHTHILEGCVFSSRPEHFLIAPGVLSAGTTESKDPALHHQGLSPLADSPSL